MRQTVITAGIAHWNTGERHTVRITDTADSLLDWYPIALPHDRPGLETLCHTDWHACQDSQWQEDTPGHWSRPVFRHGIGSNGEGGAVNNARVRQAPAPDTARQALGARLRAERESRGWTRRRLAEKLSDASAGICPVPGIASIIPQIRRWERGTAGVGERYRTLYCIAFGVGRELWDGGQPYRYGNYHLPVAGSGGVTADRQDENKPIPRSLRGAHA